MSVSINGTNGLVFSDGTSLNTSPFTGGFQFRNRIINGAMMIDQRNAGASVTPNNTYTLDRWIGINSQASKFTVQQNAGSVTPPAGFKNYLGVTSSSAYSVLSSDYFLIAQAIEGFNTSDLGFGTASASTVTLSFWVRSSLTGTFGGRLTNSAANRSYPFSYTISSANTWEQKSITIAGDTTGTWIGATNGIGIFVVFGLGSGSTYSGTANTWQAGNFVQPTGTVSVVGTNGATFYVTGVQLEKGSTATPFDFRDIGTELALCQRYFTSSFYLNSSPVTNAQTYGFGGVFTTANPYSTDSAYVSAMSFPVRMRGVPTVTPLSTNVSSATPTAGRWAWYNGSWVECTVTDVQGVKDTYFGITLSSGNNWSTGSGRIVIGAWKADSEL